MGAILVLAMGMQIASVAGEDDSTYIPDGVGTPTGRVGGGTRGYSDFFISNLVVLKSTLINNII
jgi:hypothetical protein